MDRLLWSLKTLDVFLVVVPVFCLHVLVTFTLFRPDLPTMLVEWFLKRALGRDAVDLAPTRPTPSGLVIIPSLLRDRDDFKAIVTTITSCATNEYPGPLLIVASVDGRTDHPSLYAELTHWIGAQSFAPNVKLAVTGTERRLGKMMAVEAGVAFVKSLVARGTIPRFPEIYFSIDGDGTLGPHAMRRMANRLSSRHWLTKNPRRIVSGKLAIREDLVWQGWRAFFTIRGQIHAQVAREFVVSNLMRFNRKLTPQIGVPGALYCCWSDLLLMAPHYMGFMKSIRYSQWLAWWFGAPPPTFSAGRWPSVPEALTGASDDTCMAFIASMATWKNGRLSLDAPRSPLHALGRIFVGFFVDRSHAYEPEARIYTYTPSTITGLWVQRVRWNSSRFECAGRFWRAFLFHWEIAFPTLLHLSLVLHNVVRVLLYYVALPVLLAGRGHVFLGFAFGYVFHVIEDILYSAVAFAMERDYRRSWRSLFCLPLCPLYALVFANLACAYGVTKDLLLFGNPTKFAPEWTLVKGGTSRVALLYRVRRFFALVLRSAVHGDVPLGRFWLGWRETPWTPNGFEGWTSGKRPPAVLRAPRTVAMPRPQSATAVTSTVRMPAVRAP